MTDAPTREPVTMTAHDHGNCELCDQLEREATALRAALARAEAERERLTPAEGTSLVPISNELVREMIAGELGPVTLRCKRTDSNLLALICTRHTCVDATRAAPEGR